MHAMTLHAQADLWPQGTATFAALFMEGEMQSPDTVWGSTSRSPPLNRDFTPIARTR